MLDISFHNVKTCSRVIGGTLGTVIGLPFSFTDGGVLLFALGKLSMVEGLIR